MIPARYANIVSGFVLSCLMSFLVPGISSVRTIGLTEGFFAAWMGAWLVSWALGFPVVLAVAPIARRIANTFVKPEDAAR